MEQATTRVIINDLYESSEFGGYFVSKEDVPLGTIRVIDEDLYYVKLKFHRKECTWYKFVPKKKGKKK